MSRLVLWWIIFRMMLAEKPAIKKPRLIKISYDANIVDGVILSVSKNKIRFYDCRG